MLGFDYFNGFSYAVARPFMRGRCQKHPATESFDNYSDLLIARRNVNLIQKVAQHGAPKDVLDHRAPQEWSKGLARKTRRTHPRWDHCDDPDHGLFLGGGCPGPLPHALAFNVTKLVSPGSL